MIHLSFIILSRFSYFISLAQFYNLVFLDMQLLIELVFCNKKSQSKAWHNLFANTRKKQEY